ncbi:MAG: hypothetical protein OEV92_02340 [Nitrospinota bacterium]|nr:hypothetical protein [Nitrospinota bacterium]
MEIIILLAILLVWLGPMLEMAHLEPEPDWLDMDLIISSAQPANDWVPKRKAA